MACSGTSVPTHDRRWSSVIKRTKELVMFGFENLESRQLFAGGTPTPGPTPDPQPGPYVPPEIINPNPGQPAPTLGGGVLIVNGTSANDWLDVWFDYDTGRINAYVNGATWSYNRGDVSRVLISGWKGNDVICVEMMNDRGVVALGGDGDDFIDVGGYSALTQQWGRFEGENGRDVVSFARRIDTVQVNVGVETASGTGDYIHVTDSVEEIIGSDYADTISATGATHAVVLRGGSGNDTLTGGAFNDQLHGNEGNDRLYGGNGDDYLDGGADADVISGGAGYDTARYTIGDSIFSDVEVVF